MTHTDSLFNRSKTANTLLACLILQLFATSALALPSFARQTGEACTACHIQAFGVSLTPRGRDFKLKGYAEGDASRLPALSVVAQGGGEFNISDTQEPYNSLLSGGGILLSPPKDEKSRSYFNGSVFYAGKIVQDHFGAYVQGSYMQGINLPSAHRFNFLSPSENVFIPRAFEPGPGSLYSIGNRDLGFLDKVDLRFANQVNLAGHSLEYGISVNNEPGVQDLWNTNAVWGASDPNFISSNRGLSDFYSLPMSNRSLSGKVAGASLYTLVNKTVYLEAGGYASLPIDVQRGLGRSGYEFGYNVIDGAASYWRIALQHQWGAHYLSVGHFGLMADMAEKVDGSSVSVINGALLGGSYTTKSDAYTDLGLDATYQYIANSDHVVELKGRYVRETRPFEQLVWNNSTPFGWPTWEKHNKTTESFSIDSSYIWHQTLGLSVGYQQYFLPEIYLTTSKEELRFLTTELSYTPFGKQQSLAAPWLNLRFSLKYLANFSNDFLTKNTVLLPSDSLYLNGQLAF